jgi:hypothetical protein
MEELRAVLQLDYAPDEYVFTIDRRQDPPVLHIPGEHRGPDICIPEKPEQEAWLNRLDWLMTPLWHCQWQFRNVTACDQFVDLLQQMDAER